jgi:transcriptional regulator with PAS, ATPase and Fis domain
MTLEEIELSAIQIGLKRNHGDKAKTAEDLGISLRTIYRKLDMLNPGHQEDAAHKIDSGK